MQCNLFDESKDKDASKLERHQFDRVTRANQTLTNKKSSRGINPVVVLSALGVQNILRSRKMPAKMGVNFKSW